MPCENGTILFANFMWPASNMNSIEGVSWSGGEGWKRGERNLRMFTFHA